MNHIIGVASRETLLTVAYIDDLASSVSRVALSRRGFVEECTDVLHSWTAWGGLIVDEFGAPIVIYPGVFDDLHGPNSDGEWISDLRRRHRNGGPRRNPRQSLRSRLQVYDAIFRIASQPVGREARRSEVMEVKELFRRFSSLDRMRYQLAVRSVKARHKTPLALVAAIKRLRIQFAEQKDGKCSRRCPDCGRLMQAWPRDRETWCPTCLDPAELI